MVRFEARDVLGGRHKLYAGLICLFETTCQSLNKPYGLGVTLLFKIFNRTIDFVFSDVLRTMQHLPMKVR